MCFVAVTSISYFIDPFVQRRVAAAVFYITDEAGEGVGVGVFFSPTRAVTCDHNFLPQHMALRFPSSCQVEHQAPSLDQAKEHQKRLFSFQAEAFTSRGLPCVQALGYVKLVQKDIAGWKSMNAGICLTSLLSTWIWIWLQGRGCGILQQSIT